MGPSLVDFAMQRPQAFQWMMLLPSMLSLGALMACKKTYPVNLVLLGAFTLIMALNVGVICATFSFAGLGTMVVQAATITAALFGGLTLYAFKSKRDFSFLGAILWPCLFAMTCYGFLSIFFPSHARW